MKPFAALAATGVHEATSDHAGAGGFVVQVVAVNELPALAADAEHEATRVGPVTLVPQVVVT